MMTMRMEVLKDFTFCAMQVPMFSASGLRVQYLKVWEKSNYKVEKWVRKVSKSGDYSTRI